VAQRNAHGRKGLLPGRLFYSHIQSLFDYDRASFELRKTVERAELTTMPDLSCATNAPLPYCRAAGNGSFSLVLASVQCTLPKSREGPSTRTKTTESKEGVAKAPRYFASKPFLLTSGASRSQSD